MKVTKFVMSNASADRSRSNSLTIRAVIVRSAAISMASSRASIASQKLRWSQAGAPTLVNRGPAVVTHQSANASFEQGATTRFAIANAR
jgi:hypothetical protein